MSDFSVNLKLYRNKKQYSQQLLAEKVGIKQTTIANYESGKRTPTIALIKKIAVALDVTLDTLVANIDQNTKQKSNLDISFVNERLLENLLNKDEDQVLVIIKELVDNNLSLLDIFELSITATMFRIGALWEIGRISVSDEHAISAIVFKAVDWLSINQVSTNTKAKKAVCLTVLPDRHTLGIKMVDALLKVNGYNSINLGGDLPSLYLLDFLRKEKPELIFLSITMKDHLDSLNNLVHLIKTDNQFNQIKIIAGGQGCVNNLPTAVDKCFVNLNDLQNWLYLQKTTKELETAG